VATADLHRLTRLQRENAAWALLRADNAAVTLSLLGAHFDHGTRRLPAPELFARIDVDLQAMRDEGFDLPRTGQAYCADWVRAGFLLRRADTESRRRHSSPVRRRSLRSRSSPDWPAPPVPSPNRG